MLAEVYKVKHPRKGPSFRNPRKWGLTSFEIDFIIDRYRLALLLELRRISAARGNIAIIKFPPVSNA